MDIASSLPKVLNLNPRSIYNKAENLKQFVKEREWYTWGGARSWGHQGAFRYGSDGEDSR